MNALILLIAVVLVVLAVLGLLIVLAFRKKSHQNQEPLSTQIMTSSDASQTKASRPFVDPQRAADMLDKLNSGLKRPNHN